MTTVIEPGRVTLPGMEAIRLLLRYRKTLYAITRVEIAKRHSGSAFGKLWIILYPALMLGIYLFVYMVIFKMRFPGYSEFDYTLYVFAGLIPYMGFAEAITTGCLSIKQNIHLVKNVMLPIELIPAKVVAASMVTQAVSLGILLLVLGAKGDLGRHLVMLPGVVLLQIMFAIGVVWIVSALAVALPDVSYFVNLAVLLLMFVSPIGFRPEMVPAKFAFMVYLNPMHYMIEMYRYSVLADHPAKAFTAAIYVIICVGAFVAGSAFFRKFKDVLVDYE